MVSIDKAVVARLKRNGKNFQILVDCEKALEFRKGKNISYFKIFFQYLSAGFCCFYCNLRH